MSVSNFFHCFTTTETNYEFKVQTSSTITSSFVSEACILTSSIGSICSYNDSDGLGLGIFYWKYFLCFHLVPRFTH